MQDLVRDILCNKVRCKLCGDVIESIRRHDMKWCSCGAVGVDGGHDYIKRGWKDPEKDISDVAEELSEYGPWRSSQQVGFKGNYILRKDTNEQHL